LTDATKQSATLDAVEKKMQGCGGVKKTDELYLNVMILSWRMVKHMWDITAVKKRLEKSLG
jgi:hypothetical protein